jgi:hypothetical protein
MKVETFWKWLAIGCPTSQPGWRNLINRFLLVHIVIAAIATVVIKSDPFDFAGTALFPAASILVGMSLAWTTRASTVLQNAELREKLMAESRPAEDYIYGYQLAILTIILMVIYISVMAAGGLKFTVLGEPYDTYSSAFFMYLIISMSLRECWGVVTFTNMLTLFDYRELR